jgi:Pre-toxin TG
VSGDLRPYRAELQSVEARLRAALADSTASVTEVALARAARDLMDEQLLRWPYAVLSNFDGKSDPETGARSEKYWRRVMESSARRDIQPLEDETVAAQYHRLQRDYNDKALELVNLPFKGPTRFEDRVEGIVYLVRPNRALLSKLMPIVASELLKWFKRHRITKDFLGRPAELGFYEFLLDRPDMDAMLRIIDEQPRDVTAYEDPSIITAQTQTAAQALMETAISFVPIVGEVVVAYEAWSGKDLFGNSLSDLDRGILGASMLLPMLGMVVKDGRAVYSETRLVRLYGGTASEWEHAISAVGRLEAGDARVLAEAEEALRLAKRLEPGLARRAAAALPGIAKPAGLLQTSVDKAVSEAFTLLSKRHPIVSTLDEYAILRILEKGPHPDLIKGQLLEELIESRLVPWLADPNGYIALGFRSPIAPGSTVLFVPGHMISDIHGRQLTDGILATWENNELLIQVVFEAKAGKSAARELRVGKGGISSLSDADRAQLRAEASRVYRTLKRRAELEGTTFTKKLEDVEKDVLADIRYSEEGGQVRRDIERLYEDVDGRPSLIYIGDRPKPVPARISPTRTKFFGVLPGDVDPTTIQSSLQGLGYNFEVIRAAIGRRDLQSISDQLTPLAQKMAEALL